MTLFNDLTWAEASEDEITMTYVDQKLGADGVRELQLMLRVLVPGKIKKGQDFQKHVSKW